MHPEYELSGSHGTAYPASGRQPGAVAYEDAPTTRFHVLVAVAAAGGQFSDGYILGTIGIALALAAEPLQLSALWLGLLGGASLAGLFLGSLLLAPLADRFGRRPLLVPTMAVFAMVSVLQFFVTAPWQLLILRLLLGLLLGIDYVVCCTVVAEFSPRRTRGRLLSLLVFIWSVGYTTAFIVGTLLAATLPHAWRWILFSSAIPSAIVFVMRLAIPESPTWLVQRGRSAAAREIVTRHVGKHVQLPVISSAPPQSLKATWTELCSAKYRRRTLVGAIFYTTLVIPYFALSTFIPAVLGALGIHDTYVGGVVYNVFILLGSGFGLWVIDKITRRQFLVGGFYLSVVILLFLVTARAAPLTAGAAAALFAFVLAASTNLCYVYLPELFPTRLRASGVGVGTAASRIGSASSTFMLPVCVESIGIHPTLALCVGVLLAGGLFCHAFAPETQGRSIEGL
jgi:putative MFS transporter